MADGWHSAVASYYDPGKGGINGRYGAGAWPGHPVTKGMNGFAHKTMTFGTLVEFQHNGHHAISRCVDRGPFVPGRSFDLLPVLADALGLHGVGVVQYRELSAKTTGGHNYLLDAALSPLSPALAAAALAADAAGVGSAGGAIKDAAGGVLDTATAVPKFLSKLSVIFSGNFWLRVLMVAGGIGLLILALSITGKQYLVPLKGKK